jgi:hypothetical protein
MNCHRTISFVQHRFDDEMAEREEGWAYFDA